MHECATCSVKQLSQPECSGCAAHTLALDQLLFNAYIAQKCDLLKGLNRAIRLNTIGVGIFLAVCLVLVLLRWDTPLMLIALGAIPFALGVSACEVLRRRAVPRLGALLEAQYAKLELRPKDGCTYRSLSDHEVVEAVIAMTSQKSLTPLPGSKQ